MQAAITGQPTVDAADLMRLLPQQAQDVSEPGWRDEMVRHSDSQRRYVEDLCIPHPFEITQSVSP
jgi:hypothetical protein